MAKDKPKKSGKKPETKPESVKEVKAAKDMKKEENKTIVSATSESPMKGFFAKKCAKDENILTIFKTPKIWGALIGEALGTLLIVMLLLTLTWQNPLYVGLGVIGVYAVIVGLSGANLNPLVTAGMMATRRMSAIRGVLYMLAQLLGGWIGLIIVNAFRLGSGTTAELPIMEEITGETFWAVALVELLGACIIAFCYARSLRSARKQPLTFAVTMGSVIILTAIFGTIIGQGFFSASGYTFMFNPIVALMYQILPTAANDFGELAGMVGLAIAAYIIFPVLGGIIGFYVSEVATRLSCGGYFCECDDNHCDKK